MSLAGTRLSLTDRAVIERGTTTPGAWNGPGAPTWATHLTAVPCRMFANAGRERTEVETLVVVEDLRLLVPLGTDVTASDRVASVTRRGTAVVTGPLGIRAVLPRASHLELILVGLS